MPKIRSLLKNAEKCSIYIFRKARKKTRNPKVKNPTRPKTRKGLARTARNPKISGPSHHYYSNSQIICFQISKHIANKYYTIKLLFQLFL